MTTGPVGRGAMEFSGTDAEMRIAPICPEDADAVADLVRLAFAAQPVALDPPASALQVSGDDVRAHLAQGGGGAVVRSSEALAGSALWSPRDGALYVSRVSVAPSFRRKGVATMLLAQAEAAARAEGWSRMTLETRLALTGNLRLFGAFGFREVSRHAHPGYDHPTFMLMEKRLSDD